MKVTIDVKCTPEEARTFLGLPDVAPLQEEMMTKMREQMDTMASAMDPEQMMKAVFPTGADSLAEMQKMFWSALGGGDASGVSQKKKK